MADLGYIAVGNIQIQEAHFPEWEKLNNAAHALSLRGKSIPSEMRFRMLILEGVKEAHARIISETSDKAALKTDARPKKEKHRVTTLKWRSKSYRHFVYISDAKIAKSAPPIKIEDLRSLTADVEKLSAMIFARSAASHGYSHTLHHVKAPKKQYVSIND